jgi:hypothetical protein
MATQLSHNRSVAAQGSPSTPSPFLRSFPAKLGVLKRSTNKGKLITDMLSLPHAWHVQKAHMFVNDSPGFLAVIRTKYDIATAAGPA